MTQMQKPLWTKGLVLSQQHLQMQDRFYEELIAFGISAIAFCPWGFHRLVLDREALAAGSLALLEAGGLFPDGMPFDIPGADAAPAPRPLEGHWRPDAGGLPVYLAVPEQRPGGHNVSLPGTGRGTRFVADVVLRRDENTGLAEKPVQLAQRNLRLLLEGEALDGHVLLPLTRVVRDSAGQFITDPDFVPPLLDFSASETLRSMARQLVELLVARSAALSGARRQRGRGLADFGVSDIANFWLLYTVNTHLPVLRHLLEVRRGHPSVLYDAMLQLAGSLTTFSPTVQPQALPAYDHADLGRCFGELHGILRELLDTVVPRNHVALPLREVEASIHATAIEHDRYLAAPQLFLAVAAEMAPDELIRRAPQLLKVSSGDQLPGLIRQALPGAVLRHSANPPSALPIKLDYQYFQLEKTGPAWDAVATGRNLAAYVPRDLPSARLELVILLPDGH